MDVTWRRGLWGPLLAVATDATTDQVVDWQVRMGYAAAVTLGGDDRIAVVSIADVSGFSWIARPFARRRLQTIDRTAGARLRERFAADHIAPPADLAERVSLLPETRREALRLLGELVERRR